MIGNSHVLTLEIYLLTLYTTVHVLLCSSFRCAPECINYLRFTSASDVWAFGVTLWEMFSYGFQPWAALTGQQILEAIDEPNFQVISQVSQELVYCRLYKQQWKEKSNKCFLCLVKYTILYFHTQRLEQPEACPKEYYTVMLKCWQHDPAKRPKFVDLMNILPDVSHFQFLVLINLLWVVAGFYIYNFPIHSL